MKIKAIAFFLGLVFIISLIFNINIKTATGNQSSIFEPNVSQILDNYVSIEVEVPLPYEYDLWSDGFIQATGTVKIHIINPSSTEKTVTITLPGSLKFQTGDVYEISYNKGMRLVNILKIPNEEGYYSELEFNYYIANRYILGLAYVSMFPNPLNGITIEGLDHYTLQTELRFLLPFYCETAQGSPFPAPDYREGDQIVYMGQYSQNVYPTIWYRSDKSALLSLAYLLIFTLLPFSLYTLIKRKKTLKVIPDVAIRFWLNFTRRFRKINLVRGAFLCVVLTSTLILSVAIVIGSNLQPKLLIASEPDTIESLKSVLNNEFGSQIDVEVYSWWGLGNVRQAFYFSNEIDIVVVGSLPLSSVAISDIQNLGASTIIVLEDYIDTPLATTFFEMFSERESNVVFLPLEDLSPGIMPIITSRLSAQRLFYLSENAWSMGVALIGILSLILVFFSSLLAVSFALNLRELNLQNIILLAGCLGGIFGWLIIIYFSASSTIHLAISLHSAPSDFPKDFVAMGFLGFGGGSMLRMGFGGLGALVAVFLSEVQKNIKFNWKILLPLVSLFIIMMNLPIIGPIMDDILLIGIAGEFTPTVTLGRQVDALFSASSYLFFSIFAYQDVSRGTFMFFLCGIALLAIQRLSKNTRTIVIFPLLLFFGRGIARVGDFAIFHYINAILVGIISGVFLIIFLLSTQKGFGWIKTQIQDIFYR